MRFLIDENVSNAPLASRLRAQGHDPVMAGDAGLLSVADPRVMIWAIGQGLPVLTRDADDFQDLHELIMAAGGHHPGMLVVHFDNDPRHNLSERAIGIAISKLESSGLPIADQLHVLNHWRSRLFSRGTAIGPRRLSRRGGAPTGIASRRRPPHRASGRRPCTGAGMVRPPTQPADRSGAVPRSPWPRRRDAPDEGRVRRLRARRCRPASRSARPAPFGPRPSRAGRGGRAVRSGADPPRRQGCGHAEPEAEFSDLRPVGVAAYPAAQRPQAGMGRRADCRVGASVGGGPDGTQGSPAG